MNLANPQTFTAPRINLNLGKSKKSFRRLENSQDGMQMVTKEFNSITNVLNNLPKGVEEKGIDLRNLGNEWRLKTKGKRNCT